MRESLNQAALFAFAEDLIRIPSENPPGNAYPECITRIEAELKACAIPWQRFGDCITATVGSGERTLYFHGHYDVVPSNGENQFSPVHKGANLFGRGSSDMKCGLAGMLYAAIAARDSGNLNGRIQLVFVPDEETAGSRGTASLLKHLDRKAIGMLTPEPTSGVIWNSCRGAITWMIHFKGRTAHVALEQNGVNAFERMLPAANRLLEWKQELRQRGSILMLGGVCTSGANFNVVPAECRFSLDRRLNPDEDFEVEKAKLRELIGPEASIEVIQEAHPASVSEGTELGMAIGRSSGAKFEPCPGLLEIRYYARLGIPAYAYGPGLLSVSHGPMEFVPKENVMRVAAEYAETALSLLDR